MSWKFVWTKPADSNVSCVRQQSVTDRLYTDSIMIKHPPLIADPGDSRITSPHHGFPQFKNGMVVSVIGCLATQ